jgi:hypothetical protein
LQAKIRAVEVERRVREVEEVEAALYELEQRVMTG